MKVYAKRFISMAHEKVSAALERKRTFYSERRWALDYGWEEQAKDVIKEIEDLLIDGGYTLNPTTSGSILTTITAIEEQEKEEAHQLR